MVFMVWRRSQRIRLPLAPTFCAHQQRLFIISLVFLFIAFCAEKKANSTTQLCSCTDYLERLHRKRYNISTIPIATIPMDKIASSFARNISLVAFSSLLQFTMKIIYGNIVRVHCYRVSNYRCVLAKRDSNSHYTRANVQNAVKMNNSYMCTIKMNSKDLQTQSEQWLLKTNAS